MKKHITRISLALFLVYSACLIFLFFNQRNMLYFPDTTRPDPPSHVEIVKVITEDNLHLEGWYFPPKDTNKPVLLFFHGNAGNISHRVYKALRYTEKGYGVLLAEYRGFGGNAGKPSEQGLYKDARAFIKWLDNQSRDMVFYGESLGTGIAVQMASEYEVAGVILEAPYSSTADVAASIYFYFPVKYLMKDQFRSIDTIENIHVPFLFLHGEKDTVIPIRFGQKLFDVTNEPKNFITIPQGRHNDLYEYGVEAQILEFLGAL